MKKRFICGMAAAAIALSGGGAALGNTAVLRTDLAAVAAGTVFAPPPYSVSEGEDYFEVKWQPVDGAEKYAVCVFIADGWHKVEEFDNDTLSYRFYDGTRVPKITNLEAGKEYRGCIYALIDGNWKTAPAREFEFTIPVSDHVIKQNPSVTVTEGDGCVDLEWYDCKGAEKYGLFVYNAGKWVVLDDNIKGTSYTLVSGKSYTVTDDLDLHEPFTLEAGKQYKFMLLAMYDGEWCTDSIAKKAFTVTMPEKAAAEKQTPDVTYTNGDGCVNLEWNECEGAKSYGIFVFVNDKWYIISATKDTSYTITKDTAYYEIGYEDLPGYLEEGKTYKIAVASRYDGDWLFSDAVKKAVTITIPEKENDVIIGKKVTQVVLEWDPVEGAELYRVAFYEANKWKVIGETTETEYILDSKTFLDDTGENIKPGMANKLHVMAYVDGQWVQVKTVRVYVRVIFVEVKNPDVTYTPGDGCAELKWNAASGAEMYAVYGKVNGKWTKFTETSNTSYTVKNLKAGMEYEVAVIAKFDGKWLEDFSKAITITPNPNQTAAYPTLNDLNINVKYHRVRLEWDGVAGAEKYGIAMYAAGKWKVQGYTNADTTTYTTPKLQPGSVYTIAICAKINGKWDTSNLASRAFKVIAL